MKNRLIEQLETAAGRFGIEVSYVADGIELLAPDGFRFDTDLHCLCIVSTEQPWPNILRGALSDVCEYGPRLERCPADCSCRWTTNL